MTTRSPQQHLVVPFFVAWIVGCTTAFPLDPLPEGDTSTTAFLGSDDDTAAWSSDTQIDSSKDKSNTGTDRLLGTETDRVVDTGTGQALDTETDRLLDTETDRLLDTETDRLLDTETQAPPEDSQTEPLVDTDECPDDPNKQEPGICGCGVFDTDSDDDGIADCNDGCPNDPNKVEPGECGCNKAEGTCSIDPLGTYHRLPVENNWHIGDIEQDGVNYRWKNAAGVSWTLVPDLDNQRLLTQADCPYHTDPGGDEFILAVEEITVTGFSFQGELYSKQN